MLANGILSGKNGTPVIVLDSKIPINDLTLIWKKLEKMYQVAIPRKRNNETWAKLIERSLVIPIPKKEDPISFIIDLQAEGIIKMEDDIGIP